MKKLLLTFEACNRYFFGDTHGYDDTYIIKSLMSPPLSTVLGTIRRTMLVQNNILEIRADKTEELVRGKSSDDIVQLIGRFDYKSFPKDDLGKIKSISPVFIVKRATNQFYYPLPFNWQIDKDKLVMRKISIVKDVLNNFSGKQQEHFVQVTGYDTKTGHNTIWADMSKWMDIVTQVISIPNRGSDFMLNEDIFSEQRQIGIKRSYENNDGKLTYNQSDSEQSFFQKVDYCFKDSAFCFGTVIELDDAVVLKDTGVEMGGDRSFFYMKLNELPQGNHSELLLNLMNHKEQLAGNKTYVILSEANLKDLRTGNFCSTNGGNLINLRRMVLHRNENKTIDDTIPARIRLKSGVRRYLPIGSIIRTDSGQKLVAEYNPAAGYDRFIDLGEE